MVYSAAHTIVHRRSCHTRSMPTLFGVNGLCPYLIAKPKLGPTIMEFMLLHFRYSSPNSHFFIMFVSLIQLFSRSHNTISSNLIYQGTTSSNHLTNVPMNITYNKKVQRYFCAHIWNLYFGSQQNIARLLISTLGV
jgi:hypothetical protein